MTTPTTLPELKTGQVLVSKRGKEYIAHKVGKPKRDTGYLEPLYRLKNGILGNKEWTLDELATAGLTLKETP